jgi:uncharacterized protein YjiS (DUF1127 family)
MAVPLRNFFSGKSVHIRQVISPDQANGPKRVNVSALQLLHSSISQTCIVQAQHLATSLTVTAGPPAPQTTRKKTMAFTTDITRFETGFAQRMESLMDVLRTQRARRAAFRRTYDELSVLNDRELNDLGISRADISTIARQAASEI